VHQSTVFLIISSDSIVALRSTLERLITFYSKLIVTSLDTFFNTLQDRKVNQGDKDAIDCEISALTCKNNALVDTLPRLLSNDTVP
jgi:hypothetical protein